MRILATTIICLLATLPLGAADGPMQGKTVKIAGLVLRWVRGEKEANLRRLEPMIREAAAKGATIVVTTECSLDGYAVADRKTLTDADWRGLGEPIPSGAYFKKLVALAKELKIYLVVGLTEADGDKRYNTVVIIGPDGTLVGKYRKQNLGHETGRNTPGKESSVFATPLGKIGVMICADRTDAKIVKRFCDNGADFLICPSGGMFGPKNNDPIVQARSKENGIHIVFVHPVEFLATGPDGKILQCELLGSNLLVTKEQVDGTDDVRRIYFFDVPVRSPPIDKAPQLKVRTAIGAGHSASVTSVAFSPDFKTFASASGDATVRLWDVATGKELATFEGHRFPVTNVAYSPDGKTLYSDCSWNGDARRWDVATRKSTPGDGATLLPADAGQLQKRRSVFSYTVPLSLRSPDGKTIATVESKDPWRWTQRIKLLDGVTGKHLTSLQDNAAYVHGLEFSSDGQTLAVSDDTRVSLWELATGKLVNTLVIARMWPIQSLTFSRDGRTLASVNGYHKNQVHLWDVATGKNVAMFEAEHEVASAAFIDSDTLALGGYGLVVLDAATGKMRPTLDKSRGWYAGTRVAVSHDGKMLAAGEDQGGPLTLWDIAQRKKLSTLSNASVHWLAFSSDDKVLASAHSDGSVKLWNVAAGANMASFTVHSKSANSVALSRDGAFLASASSDGTVQLWDLAAGKNVATLKGHEESVNSVAFHPHGQWLASGGSDGTVRLWEVASGKNFATLSDHRFHVNSVAFSPDGKTLASTGSDGTIRLWDMLKADKR